MIKPKNKRWLVLPSVFLLIVILLSVYYIMCGGFCGFAIMFVAAPWIFFVPLHLPLKLFPNLTPDNAWLIVIIVFALLNTALLALVSWIKSKKQ